MKTKIENRNALLSGDPEQLMRECSLDFHKASGNGGQKVNKTSSAVRILHKPSGISAVSSDSRSQSENRKHAFRRLRMNLAFQLRLEPDPDFRLKDPVSMRNDAYPLWVAKLLDVMAASGFDIHIAAERLAETQSALTKLLRRDDAVWREFSQMKNKIRNTAEQL